MKARGPPRSEAYEFVKHASVIPDELAPAVARAIFKQKDRPEGRIVGYLPPEMDAVGISVRPE